MFHQDKQKTLNFKFNMNCHVCFFNLSERTFSLSLDC